jgi:hypothetical protein
VLLLVALVLVDSASVEVAAAQRPLPAWEDTLPRPAQQFDVTRFDSLTASALRGIIDSAAAKGLPTRPLINLALQGAARRAVRSMILNTVRAHASAMEEARRILGIRSSAGELDACAMAMRQGVDGGTMSLLRQARAGNTIIKPCVALTDLIGRGVPFADANNAVITISRLPRSDDFLDTMLSLVAKNALRGGPTMAVEVLQRYVRETVAANARSPSGTDSRLPDR